MKDFNIREEAGGSGQAIIKNFTAQVEDNTLEIHLYWAGKGTTGIPYQGNYGPLISAISVTQIESIILLLLSSNCFINVISTF